MADLLGAALEQGGVAEPGEPGRGPTTAGVFRACMDRGVDPGDAEVQLLVEQSRAAWRKNGMRERHLEQLAWNPEVTKAWFALGRLTN